MTPGALRRAHGSLAALPNDDEAAQVAPHTLYFLLFLARLRAQAGPALAAAFLGTVTTRG